MSDFKFLNELSTEEKREVIRRLYVQLIMEPFPKEKQILIKEYFENTPEGKRIVENYLHSIVSWQYYLSRKPKEKKDDY